MLKIELFTTTVEDERLIDYVFIANRDTFSLGFHIDSSGENIVTISKEDIEKGINRTGLKYSVKEFNYESNLDGLQFIYDQYLQVSEVKLLIFQNEIKISINGIGLNLT